MREGMLEARGREGLMTCWGNAHGILRRHRWQKLREGHNKWRADTHGTYGGGCKYRAEQTCSVITRESCIRRREWHKRVKARERRTKRRTDTIGTRHEGCKVARKTKASWTQPHTLWRLSGQGGETKTKSNRVSGRHEGQKRVKARERRTKCWTTRMKGKRRI